MSFLTQAFAAVTTFPGSGIYHIVALFALEAAFGIALGHRRWQGPASHSMRLAIAAGLSGLGQGILLALGTLATSGLFSAPALLAPLDRAISLATLLLLGWALVFREGNRWADIALGAGLIAVLIAYIAAGIQWYEIGATGVFYNPHDTAWELAKLGVILFSILGLFLLRPPDWGTALGLFLILLVGVAYHLLNFVPTDNYPAAERIAELSAFPLLVVIAYQNVFNSLRAAAPQTPEAAPTMAAKPVVSLTPQAASALAAISAVDEDRADIVARITQAVGRTLLADVTLLFNPPGPDGSLACAGAFDLIRETQLPGFNMPAARATSLVAAISRGRPLRLRPPARQAELDQIGLALGLNKSGPALMMPLADAERSYGAIMIFSAFSQKEWSNDDQELLVSLAAPIVATVIGRGKTVEKVGDLQRQLADAIRRVEAAQAETRIAQEKAEEIAFELDGVREQAKRSRQQAESLSAIIKAGAAVQAGEPSERELAELAALQTSYRRALEDLAALNQQLANTQLEVKNLRGQLAEAEEARPVVVDHTDELITLNRQLAEAGAEATKLRGQLAEARASQPTIIDRTEELAALTRQLAETRLELESLRARLAVAQETKPAVATPDEGEAEEVSLLTGQLETAQVEIERLQEKLALLESALARPSASNPPPQLAVLVSLIQDLRQPMSSILGYTDLLLGESVGILGALQRNFLERIKASTERMTTILDDLIRVTAIDTGTLTLDQQSVQVAEVIDDAFTSVGAQFREKGISLRMDIADDLPLVEADHDAIYQIVSRLLSNACAASAPSSEVVVTAGTQADDYLIISVRDAGGGIRPADQARVFARAYRADRPLIEGIGDTGVGLSVAKALTEAQGGRIWVESEVGKGSVFSVLLPTSVNGHADERV
jgi:signal transduction histidine kinase